MQGTDVWGNATWRNIIPGYTLAGAVTEINAPAVWAWPEPPALAEAAERRDAARWRKAPPLCRPPSRATGDAQTAPIC